VLFGIITNVSAQILWETTINPAEQGCAANTGLYGPNNQLYISVVELLSDTARGKLFRLDDVGAITGSRTLDYPELRPYSANLVGLGNADELLVLGTARREAPSDSDSARVAFYRFNADLAQLEARLVGRAGKLIGYLEGCTGPDGNVHLVYQTDDWAGNLHQYEALKITAEGDSIIGHRIMEGMPYAPVTSLAMHPSGATVLGSSYADWGFPAISGGTVSFLTDGMQLDSTYSFSHVDPAYPEPWNTPMDPVQVLPLPSGNLLISGHYWADFGANRGAVIQHTNAQAQVIDQFIADSPWATDRPAMSKAMSLAADGTLYFAQVNGWVDGDGYFSPFPTQVQVFHLDTSLHVPGSHVVDGFADSTFFSPNFVLAAPDGGVVVGGMARDLNVPASLFRAWVVKLGPESFTTGVQTPAVPVLGLYPNPGTNGFTLELRTTMEQGRIEMVDAQGRLVLSQPLDGIRASIPARGLSSGLYTILVRNKAGSLLQSLRWVKG